MNEAGCNACDVRRGAHHRGVCSRYERRSFDMLIRVGFFSLAEALEAIGDLAVREERQTRRRAPHRNTTSGCAYLVRSDGNEFTSQSRRHLLAEEF
jgi:hypothetical protein